MGSINAKEGDSNESFDSAASSDRPDGGARGAGYVERVLAGHGAAGVLLSSCVPNWCLPWKRALVTPCRFWMWCYRPWVVQGRRAQCPCRRCAVAPRGRRLGQRRERQHGAGTRAAQRQATCDVQYVRCA